MSSSVLAKRTQVVANEQSIPLHFQAMDFAMLDRYLDQVDLVLLGPHLKYKLEPLQKQATPSTKIVVIDKAIYRTFSGQELLNQILSLKLDFTETKEMKQQDSQQESEEKGWTNQSPFKSYFTPEMLEALRWKR